MPHWNWEENSKVTVNCKPEKQKQLPNRGWPKQQVKRFAAVSVQKHEVNHKSAGLFHWAMQIGRPINLSLSGLELMRMWM